MEWGIGRGIVGGCRIVVERAFMERVTRSLCVFIQAIHLWKMHNTYNCSFLINYSLLLKDIVCMLYTYYVIAIPQWNFWSVISKILGQVTTLKGLNIGENPLKFPSQEIISQGVAGILKYLRMMLFSKSNGSFKPGANASMLLWTAGADDVE